jgi:hypothetical protein
MRLRRGSIAILAVVLLVGCSRVKESDKRDSSPAPRERSDAAAELQLDYRILLDDNGEAKRVTEKYHFHGGDRFRIELRPAFSADVYMVNRGPRQANYSFLFPTRKISLENPLPEKQAVTLPGGSEWYVLDNRPGIENVVLIASTMPLVEFNTPEQTIPRDECEDRIALLERDYRPASSRRFEDRDWTKLFAAKGERTAILLRLPLDHR